MIVLRLFLNFDKSQPGCSYKVCSYKKSVQCILKDTVIFLNKLRAILVQNTFFLALFSEGLTFKNDLHAFCMFSKC